MAAGSLPPPSPVLTHIAAALHTTQPLRHGTALFTVFPSYFQPYKSPLLPLEAVIGRETACRSVGSHVRVTGLRVYWLFWCLVLPYFHSFLVICARISVSGSDVR